MDLRERIYRFKQWQEQPYEYKVATDEEHHCNNCGSEFKGNFCPFCSQKAGMGRIGWRSVHQGIMDIWGLGTRSLLYSIWQLLWRPGHIIGDYIDGKRQVSFPPVKMLFIVAVLFSMVNYWFVPIVLGVNMEPELPEEQMALLGNFSDWIQTNYSWFALIMALMAVVPTWTMFRYTPHHPLHTLPEGFFIQIFLAVLMIVFNFLFLPLGMVDIMIYTFTVFVFYGIYYIIVYKHVFGFGLWGTLWRSGFVLLTVLLLMTFGIALTLNFNQYLLSLKQEDSISPEQIIAAKILLCGAFLMAAFFVLSVGAVFNYIATRKLRQEYKQETISSL